MSHNQSQFAYALCIATADENKRLGAEIVNSPMSCGRSRAEMLNLKIIHSSTSSIIAEDVKQRFDAITASLDLLGQDYTATIYYALGKDITITHVYVSNIDLLPLFKSDDISLLEKYVEEELEYQKTQMQINQLEDKNGIAD